MAYPRWRSHMVLAIAWSIFAGVPDDQPPAFGQPPSLDQLLGKEEKPTGGPPPAGPPPEQFNLLTPAVPPAPPPPPPDPGDVGNQKAKLGALKAVQEARQDAGVPGRRPQAVRTILSLADQPGIEAAQKCALLEIGIELAEAGDDPQLLREAVESMNRAFTGHAADQAMLRFLQRLAAAGPVAEFNNIASSAVREACQLGRSLMERQRSLPLGKHDFSEVETAVEIARELVGIAPPAIAAQERAAVEAVGRELGDAKELVLRAGEAKKQLAGGEGTRRGRTDLGLFEVWKSESSDWSRVLEHLQECHDDVLREHARAEAGLADAASGDQWYAIGDRWWGVKGQKGGGVIGLDAVDAAVIPESLPERFRLHAAVCYEKAINAGLVNPLDRDLAKQRIQEVRKAAPKAEPAVVKAPQVVLQKATFDPVAFDRIEGERSAEMARFRDAWRRGNSHDYREATQKLTGIRERWVAALDLGNRANNMQGQQGAIAKVLRADGSFADGHLANCYLQMMLGNRAGAAASLKTALDLMQKQPNEQVFCGIQWLDLGRAAIRLGDRKLAEKVRNVFKKMFPNHPGVRLLSALTLRDKRLFAEAEREFEQALEAAPQNSLVAAELAWCLVSQPVPDDPQDYDRAAELVDQFLGKPSSSAWLFLRAKAALAAKDGRWAEAIQILRAAEAAAPLLYRDDLQKQQQAYEKKSNFKPTP